VDLPGAAMLLSPAGLFGLLAIAIPVAVHLISRGRGRRVLIGNIELVRAARRTRVTALRLTQRLLLLLRISIVVVATLLLAEIALQGSDSAEPGVRYVTPGWLRAANDTERADLLSLEPAPRVLTKGYPTAPGYDPGPGDPDYDIWPLLAERLSALRHAGEVDVYAEPRMAAFGEQRPQLPNGIRWHLAADTTAPAALSSDGVVIHDSDRTDAVRQVERALAALRRHRVPQMRWQTCLADDVACISKSRDWVVWLAAAEPPADLGDARLYRPQGETSQPAISDPRYPDVLLEALLSDAQRREAWQSLPASSAVLNAGAALAESVPLPNRPLHLWLGLLLVALWAVERLLSERGRTADD
jgi:hypothetical protein